MGRGRPRTKHLNKERVSSKSAVERKPIRPLERQRMRPWLVQLLDSSTCHQLVWVNKPQNLFRMSWKHAAGQTFDPNSDATLFELWARHTGKYYTGDQPDPKRWKANFRCALNSLQDVVEEKSQGVRKGNNAYKVYKFLDHKRPKKNTPKRLKGSDDEEFDAEIEVLKKNGTRSRPRISTPVCLDSEGSENAYSSASDCGQSDWDETTTHESIDHSCQDQEMEMETESCDKSPLPDFEQLCQSTNIFPLTGRPSVKKQESSSIEPVECTAASFSPIRSADLSYSPEYNTQIEDYNTHIEEYDTHIEEYTTHTDEYNTHIDEVSPSASPYPIRVQVDETEQGLIFDLDCEILSEFTQQEGDCFVLEAPETIIATDVLNTEPCPNVIVLNEDSTHDYVYTSMSDL